jgi:hypothetical protein
MRMKAVAVFLIGLLGLAANARQAGADPLQTINPNAISGPGTIFIDFEDLAGAVGEITDWYAALGLTISGGLHTIEAGLPASYDNVAATNGGVVPAPDITFALATGRSFGFDIFTIGSSVTTFVISAYANGVQTLNQTVSFNTGGEPHFIGIVELDPTKWFDTVVVSSASEASQTTAFAMDNIRMKVPEPGSLSLLTFGVAALFLSRGRRARKA